MIVEPLVETIDDLISVVADAPFAITVDLLDASPLASRTQSDPIYGVILLPRLGTLSVAEGGQRPRRRRRLVDWLSSEVVQGTLMLIS